MFSVTLAEFSSFNPLIQTYWKQDKPWGCSVFAGGQLTIQLTHLYHRLPSYYVTSVSAYC